jgi:hypothetical protein
MPQAVGSMLATKLAYMVQNQIEAETYKNAIHTILLLSNREWREPNIKTQCWKLQQCLSKIIWAEKGTARNEYLQCQIYFKKNTSRHG